MNKDWKPSEDCFDVLSLAKINKSFAESQIPEFKLYWLRQKKCEIAGIQSSSNM